MYVRHTSQLILSEFLPLLQRNLDSPDHVLTHLCAKCVTVLTVHFASDNVALLLLRCPHKTAVKALSLLFETSGHCIVAPTRGLTPKKFVQIRFQRKVRSCELGLVLPCGRHLNPREPTRVRHINLREPDRAVRAWQSLTEPNPCRRWLGIANWEGGREH